MDDEKWFKRKKIDKITKYISIIILFYVLYSLFFNFIFVIYFFAAALIISIFVMTLECIQIVRNKIKAFLLNKK
ncbi:hypothetical protein CBF30_04750 [Vagococcus entomophilus]|uniref:Uncharacterized protein n=1 Tax=Vagococcus entomophilus TaxID=1160095 RepID=A0A430AKY4_9ENTE|nr:hypothetical protein CBF30_04750 [Vagococcus entomophilus]